MPNAINAAPATASMTFENLPMIQERPGGPMRPICRSFDNLYGLFEDATWLIFFSALLFSLPSPLVSGIAFGTDGDRGEDRSRCHDGD